MNCVTFEVRGDLVIRSMSLFDIPSVIEIENESYPYVWFGPRGILFVYQQPNVIPIVAETEGKLVGFAFHEVQSNWLALTNLAVHPDYRRRGIGSLLISVMSKKLKRNGRNLIRAPVAEKNLDGQMFLKAFGFRAKSLVHDILSPDAGPGCYYFEFNPFAGQPCNSSTT